MNIFLSGSSGLVGSALKMHLEVNGHKVTPLKRTYEESIDFNEVDAVIHLAGESIAEERWNSSKKERIESSRVLGTNQLTKQILNSIHKPSLFICASAIGFYGDRSTELLDEDSVVGQGFLPDVCFKWEQATDPLKNIGIRTVNLRTGIVLSSNGGALKKMLPPFKLGGGGILGSGKQYMSWISLDDMIRAIQFILDNELVNGPVNLVSPNPVTNYEFTKILGKVLKRPTFLPLPAFAARLLFGEMADALLLSSTRVVPNKLQDYGYEFKHNQLQAALEDILT